MKIPSIKKAVENFTISQLKEAETALSNEQPITIEIEGDDEGEKTHPYVGRYMDKEKMETESVDFNSALRAYTSKVRASIS